MWKLIKTENFSWICFVLIGYLFSSNLSAQTATGQITGVVQDSSGGVLPGATIKVTSERTFL